MLMKLLEKTVKNNLQILSVKSIQNHIYTIRGEQVMIDSELAKLYDVETKVLNQAVKRNIDRFPEFFRFQLTDDERTELVTNCDRFGNLKHSSVNPYAFTEQGVAMLSAVLRSETAVKVSIQIMQAFVNMKRFISTNAGIFQRLDKMEQKQIETDDKFEKVFQALEDKSITPKQGVFFDGQIFDAYKLVSDIFKSAKNSIYIIDNYIDESVLVHLAKRKEHIETVIFTKNITKQLKLDIDKFNAQYPKIKLIELKNAHDRFIIIDEKTAYHLGASLKDLGKKWFAFTKMENDSIKLINKLHKMIKGIK